MYVHNVLFITHVNIYSLPTYLTFAHYNQSVSADAASLQITPCIAVYTTAAMEDEVTLIVPKQK